jgi:hypothetical protein
MHPFGLKNPANRLKFQKMVLSPIPPEPFPGPPKMYLPQAQIPAAASRRRPPEAGAAPLKKRQFIAETPDNVENFLFFFAKY